MCLCASTQYINVISINQTNSYHLISSPPPWLSWTLLLAYSNTNLKSGDSKLLLLSLLILLSASSLSLHTAGCIAYSPDEICSLGISAIIVTTIVAFLLLLLILDKNSFSRKSHLIFLSYCNVYLLFVLNVRYTQNHVDVYPSCFLT